MLAAFGWMIQRGYLTGVSYYFAHHAMKLQGDDARLVDDGEFGDEADQSRAQLQISY